MRSTEHPTGSSTPRSRSAGPAPHLHGHTLGYADRLVPGGFPDAIARDSPRRRTRFLDAHVRDLITREVSQLSEIERTGEMATLRRLLAARSGQLSVTASSGNSAGLPNRAHLVRRAGGPVPLPNARTAPPRRAAGARLPARCCAPHRHRDLRFRRPDASHAGQRTPVIGADVIVRTKAQNRAPHLLPTR